MQAVEGTSWGDTAAITSTGKRLDAPSSAAAAALVGWSAGVGACARARAQRGFQGSYGVGLRVRLCVSHVCVD